MSVGADKIISNIKADAQAKSDEIISKATTESEKILADGEVQAQPERSQGRHLGPERPGLRRRHRPATDRRQAALHGHHLVGKLAADA